MTSYCFLNFLSLNVLCLSFKIVWEVLKWIKMQKKTRDASNKGLHQI